MQQYLELLLQKAGNISQLSFLRMLNLAHSQTSSLVDSLKQYDLSHITARLASDRAVSDGIVPGGAGNQVVSVASMLDTALEELFMPYTEGQKYLERESKNIAELYTSFLHRFTRYHVRALCL